MQFSLGLYYLYISPCGFWVLYICLIDFPPSLQLLQSATNGKTYAHIFRCLRLLWYKPCGCYFKAQLWNLELKAWSIVSWMHNLLDPASIAVVFIFWERTFVVNSFATQLQFFDVLYFIHCKILHIKLF